LQARSIYILYIYIPTRPTDFLPASPTISVYKPIQDPSRKTQSVAYNSSLRVSRSRKITCNTSFAVYRIHFRHAQTSVQSSPQYKPIFSIAHDSNLVVFQSPRHYGKFIIWGVPQSLSKLPVPFFATSSRKQGRHVSFPSHSSATPLARRCNKCKSEGRFLSKPASVPVIYNPYIYRIKTANPSVLFNYIDHFFLGTFYKSSFLVRLYIPSNI
jgi:hypothetical protein